MPRFFVRRKINWGGETGLLGIWDTHNYCWVPGEFKSWSKANRVAYEMNTGGVLMGELDPIQFTEDGHGRVLWSFVRPEPIAEQDARDAQKSKGLDPEHSGFWNFTTLYNVVTKNHFATWFCNAPERTASHRCPGCGAFIESRTQFVCGKCETDLRY